MFPNFNHGQLVNGTKLEDKEVRNVVMEGTVTKAMRRMITCSFQKTGLRTH